MTQTTDTDICNMALAGCGARSTIASLREQSNEARKCLLFYDTTRDELLRSAQWNFSRKTDYLTLLKAAPGTPENPVTLQNPGYPWNPRTMPALPWQYAYAYPSDAVRVWQILPQLQTVPVGSAVPIFSVPTDTPPPGLLLGRQAVRFIEGLDTNQQGAQQRCLLTNQEQAVVVYGARIESPELWDAQFKTAMIGALSWRLCIPLSGDKTLAKMGHDNAAEAIKAARMTDGNEGTTNVNTIPDWIAIRGFAGDWIGPGALGYTAGWINPSFLTL